VQRASAGSSLQDRVACRVTEEQMVAYNGIVVQICSYVLASNGDVEQTQDQQSNEVMTDHVNLAICKKALCKKLLLSVPEALSKAAEVTKPQPCCQFVYLGCDQQLA